MDDIEPVSITSLQINWPDKILLGINKLATNYGIYDDDGIYELSKYA